MDNLFTDYHESFSILPGKPIPIESICLDETHYCGPGFFYITDKKGKYIRCGALEDIQDVRKIEDKNVDISVGVAWFTGEAGYKQMRSFKQKFKRVLIC